MIKDKESFEAIQSMIQSEGWKLFSAHLETIGKNSFKNALDAQDDRVRSRHIDEYKAYRRVLEDVYGIYKIELEKYKGE